MHIHCPQCEGPVELEHEAMWNEVSCPSCGSSFRLVDVETCSLATSRPRTIAHFVLLTPVGSGAFGTVWKARDTRLDRIVALKIPRARPHGSEADLFFREARAAAQLRHPHIVSVHEVGCSDDTAYIVSDFVDGASLADWLTAKRPNPREAAELCATIASALHHAHEAGVVHRDLKPSNIMMDRSGTPHIMDFGLAKREAGEITMTVEGKLLGTPAYMPPEQARGQGHQADRRSDVYSLGVILFELLTGRLPFTGNARMLLMQVLHDEPPSPRQFNRSVARDLETICLKCLQKDAARRYETAAALADDLRRFAAGEAIRARPEPLAYKLWRRARRHRVALTATATVLLVAAASGYLIQRSFGTARQVQSRTAEIVGDLAGIELSEPFLLRVESRIDELGRLDPESARLLRGRLYTGFGDVMHSRMNEPGLTRDRVLEIETALAALEARDPDRSTTLRRQLDRRLRSWEPLVRLSSPFTDLSTVFESGTVAVEGGSLVCRGAAGDLVPTRVASQGNVECSVRYDDATWQDAAQLGVLLDAGAEQHYAMVLRVLADSAGGPDGVRSFAAARRAGGEVALQIQRNGRVIRTRRYPATAVPDGSIEIKASRVGETLTAHVGGIGSVRSLDLFALGSTNGKFAIYWPNGVRVAALFAAGQSLPIAPRPMEKGDELFGRGGDAYAEALEFYREQALLSAGTPVGQEARYKEALCRLKLNQTAEAQAILEPLATEAGERWPILGRCHLLLLYLRQNRLRAADELIDNLFISNAASAVSLLEGEDSANPLEHLFALIPSDLFAELLEANIRRYSSFQALRFDSDLAIRLERLASLVEYLDVEPKDRALIHQIQVYAFWMLGRTERALELAESMVVARDLATQPAELRMAMLATYCWLLRATGNPTAALETVDRYLYRQPGEYRAEYLPMLLERVRILAALERFDEAERVLGEYLRLTPREAMTYPESARAHLMRGFLHERRGDREQAISAWKAGLYKAYDTSNRPDPPDPFRLHRWECVLYGIMLGSLVNDYTARDHEQLLAQLTPLMGGVPVRINPVLQFFGSRDLRNAFRSPAAHEFLRRVAFLEASPLEIQKLPLMFVVVEIFRAESFDRALSEAESEIVWRVSERGYEAFFQGEWTTVELVRRLFALMSVWNDARDRAQRWAEASSDLAPELRSGFAYLCGIRQARLGKPSVAAEFFRLAAADCPADSPLAHLLRAELDRITAGSNADF